MKVHETQARAKLLRVQNRNRGVNLFGIADLDDAMWNTTQWFVDASEADCDYSAVILVVHAFNPPIVSALALPEDAASYEKTQALLRATLPHLPKQIFGAVTPGFETILRERYTLTADDSWDRMILTQPAMAMAADTSGVEPLHAEDENDLKELFEMSFPEGWAGMNFSTGQNFGIRGPNGKWIATAGARHYSPRYSVAVITNVAVHPQHRNKGLARRVTGKVCQSLLPTVSTIGLNVVEGNIPAVKCYERLGFSFVMKYQGWVGETTN